MLETDFHTRDGVLQVVDSMPIRDEAPDVVRIARCLEGRVSVRMELILRFDYRPHRPLGPARRRRRPDRDRRARRCAPDHRPADPRPRPRHGGRVRARGGRRGPVRAHLVPLARARARSGRRHSGDRRHDRMVGGVVRALARGGPPPRHRPSQPDHAEGAHVRADRRHRRRADDVAAGAHRRRAQLGLPLLLGARRDARAAVADARGLHGRGRRVARLAAARRRRVAVGDADHVRAGGRAAADRARARLAARLRGLVPRADRQRRVGPVPARRLRRADGRARTGDRGRDRARRRRPGGCRSR